MGCSEGGARDRLEGEEVLGRNDIRACCGAHHQCDVLKDKKKFGTAEGSSGESESVSCCVINKKNKQKFGTKCGTNKKKGKKWNPATKHFSTEPSIVHPAREGSPLPPPSFRTASTINSLKKNAAINKHNAKPPTDYRTSELLWMLNRDEKIATKLRKVIADSQAKRKKVEEHRSRMEKMVQSSCRDLYSWLAGHESTVCSVFESMLRRVRDGSGGHQRL